MNTPVLTAGQIEFAEIFDRLEKQFKISKAAVARALRIERSYVSMLINGQRTPHIRTLEAMRELEKRMMAGRGPEPAGEEETEFNRICKQLAVLEKTDRTKFEVAKTVIESLAPAPAGSKPAAAAAAASKLLKKAAASVSKAK